jgi:hypothetical protein
LAKVERKRKTFHTVDRSANYYNHYGKQHAVPQKLKIELSYDPIIPLLAIYPEELTMVNNNVFYISK